VADGQVAGRAALREHAGRFVVVVRETARAALFDCPCGCGEVVAINLDPRTGLAWRLRIDEGGATLMPSVWRTTGCRSHFIVWRSGIWWCRFRGEDLSEDDEASSDRAHRDASAGVGEEWPEAMDVELREEWRRIRGQRRRNPPPG
jgi:hypothetical protein